MNNSKDNDYDDVDYTTMMKTKATIMIIKDCNLNINTTMMIMIRDKYNDNEDDVRRQEKIAMMMK